MSLLSRFAEAVFRHTTTPAPQLSGPDWYTQQAEAIYLRAQAYSSPQSPEDARNFKKGISLLQTELRHLRAAIVQIERASRQAGRMQRGGQGLDTGTKIFFGVGAAKSARARQKERAHQQEITMLAPYAITKGRIDQFLLSLDHYKLELDQWITQKRR